MILCLAFFLAPSILSHAEDQSEPVDETIYIASSSDFITAFTNLDNFNNSDVVIQLTGNINMQGVDLSGLGYYQDETLNSFNGTFDGDGYCISNLSLSLYSNYIGLFPKAEGANIKNLKIAGSVTFDLENAQDYSTIYAGVLVGHGTNVTIENCSIGSQETVDSNGAIVALSDNAQTEINIANNINLHYGDVAGYLTSQVGSVTIPSQRSQIKNSISYLDHTINISRNNTINIGSIVGTLTNGSRVYNIIASGNMNISSTVALSSVYVGGVVGNVIGQTNLTNSIFNGQMLRCEQAVQGAIVGRADDNATVNYSYYTYNNFARPSSSTTSQTIYPIGTSSETTSTLSYSGQVLNEDFFANTSRFDQSVEDWNFDTIWLVSGTELKLQRFETFAYAFARSLDSQGRISTAYFELNGENVNSLSARWGDEIIIVVNLKSEYFDFYTLTGINVNESSIQSQYERENIYSESDGRLSGFRLTLSASNLNDGNYSFAMTAITYICQVAVSDDAIASSAGYVRVNSGSLSTGLPMTYTYDSKNNTISAVRNGIYVFDYWELYYQDDNGDFTVLVEDYTNENATINVNFGQAPFNQEFKLVAYFTDEDAVLIDFPSVNSDRIKSISLGGEIYNGETIAVAPNSTVTLEIVTNPNYQLDVEEFTSVISQLYSGGSTANLLVEERLNEETGETTYIFNLNTSYLSSSTIINIDLRATRVGGDNNGLIYVYIFVPLAIVLIAVVVIVVLKLRSGKGKGKTKQKVKEESYKDYYM